MSMRLLVFALLLLLPAGLRADDDPAAGLADNLKKLLDVFTILDQQAADPVSPDQAFYQGAIPGMLRTLDPHSIFFDPDQFQQVQQMQRSESASTPDRLRFCKRWRARPPRSPD